MVELRIKDSSRVRLMIAKTGQSLRGFASEIGISHTYLSQVLSGKRNPSPTTGNKIAKGLGLKVEDIFLIISVANVNRKVGEKYC
jgi:transcriptional regulator with XRE-family HTH domain